MRAGVFVGHGTYTTKGRSTNYTVMGLFVSGWLHGEGTVTFGDSVGLSLKTNFHHGKPLHGHSVAVLAAGRFECQFSDDSAGKIMAGTRGKMHWNDDIITLVSLPTYFDLLQPDGEWLKDGWQEVVVEQCRRAREMSGQDPYKPPRNDPFGSKYDMFFSYRVQTDAAVTGRLYEKLLMPTMEKVGPSLRSIEPFLDAKCLRDGESWEAGFVNGLSKSQVYCVLLSTGDETSKGSLGGFANLAAENAPVDNLLLELELAAELDAHPESCVSKILPVFFGAHTAQGFTPFDFKRVGQLPNVVAEATAARVRSSLAILGVSPSERAGNRTVKEVVEGVMSMVSRCSGCSGGT